MKRSLLLIAALAALLIVGCEKKKPNESTGGNQSDPLAVELTVTGIENNCATINVTVTAGKASKAVIIEAMKYEDVSVDTSKDIQLINFVQTNGKEVSLPYTVTLTDISVGKEMFTAVAVYNESGRAEVCKFAVWNPVGEADGWSTDNNPGSLDETKW